MEPLRLDWQKLGAETTQAKREILDDVDQQFDKVLEETAEPKEAGKDHAQPLQEALQDHDRERLAQTAPTLAASPNSPSQPAAAPLSPPAAAHAGAHRPPAGLPVVVPDPAWQPPRPRELEAEVHRLPRRRSSKRTEAVVDGDLVEALRHHGLELPIGSDEDRRLEGKAAFDAAWVRFGSEDTWSVAWRSPQDAAGTWQRCFVSPTVLTVETAALGRLQTIEVKGDAVHITRTTDPPPAYAG